MIPCICIDNNNCPIDFDYPSEWLVKDQKYHIVDIQYIPRSKTIGFKLSEKLDVKFYPYIYFRSDRFVIDLKYEKQLLEMIYKDSRLSEDDLPEVKEKLRLQEI